MYHLTNDLTLTVTESLHEIVSVLWLLINLDNSDGVCFHPKEKFYAALIMTSPDYFSVIRLFW